MKWLKRLFTKKQKVPLPPKPYIDTASTGRHMIDPRLYDMTDLKHIDPEKPHWHDPRFESRESVPFFDFFGYNRDWSWTLFKLAGIFFALVMYMEARTFAYSKDDGFKVTGTTMISSTPDYARDDTATQAELEKAGFSYVGVKKIDNLEIRPPK
ncbi:hypothetical protein AGDE_00961 [Angomonas deanei]|uniref:Uncharacterized protein n=1 Tax=Angomonas deanei TaxID=59799 RepID=S9VJI8_9TRYP|nr:hypothetical protein AGDE_04511 [Angomonas deanei]EPY42962.1 hypothetical protein AGDE_00961 [Angomonas deanei]CAD2216291.1 hypothetical protein, conserved [Angomonas deanei]|eukprot:EPY39417.1 hypothetical protein AGDE_04511 [Angomonas deanei]